MELWWYKINARIHHTLKVKQIAYLKNFEMYYLPQYSPDLAPVELVFGLIKRKLRWKISNQGWNFSKNDGKDAIVNAWCEIDKESIKRMWIQTIKASLKYIFKKATSNWIQTKHGFFKKYFNASSISPNI